MKLRLKTKKMLSIALTVAVFFCSVPFIGVSEAFALSHGVLEYEYDGSEIIITGCDPSASGDLVIPEKILLGKVTGIDYAAFEGCDLLTSITIPKNVYYIDCAFFGCTSLMNVYVDASNAYYRDIDGVLFDKEVTWLIYYPEGRTGAYTIPDSVEFIDYWAFNYCLNLTELSIPSKVEYVDVSCFILCGALEALNISADNEFYKSVDGVVFSKDGTQLIGCPVGKSGAYTVPESVTAIEWYAFSNCTLITEITMTDNVKSIGEGAFGECTSLGIIALPADITRIDDYAFSGCISLTEIAFPDKTAEIGENAFYLCESLSDVFIPDGLVSVGDSAFFGCPALLAVEIPLSVDSIGDEAFGFYYNDEYDTVKVENFLIRCAYGSAAHIYAEENGFVCEFFEPDSLVMKPNSGLFIDKDSGTITSFKKKQTSSDFLAQFINKNIAIYNNGVLSEGDFFVKTGSELVFFKGEEIAESYIIIVSGDVNGDGDVGVSDARKILRVAVKLDSFGEDIWARYASDVVGFDGEIRIDDARAVLRTAVGLGVSRSKDEILNFYKETAGAVKQDGAIGYTKKLWQEITGCSITSPSGFEGLFKTTLNSFINTKNNPDIGVFEKGSEDAKAAFPACTLTDISAIQSVDCKPFGDKFQITIVMQDETNPRRSSSKAGQISDNVPYFDEIKNDLENDSGGFEVEMDEKNNQMKLDDLTIVCTFRKNGELISMTHTAPINFAFNIKIGMGSVPAIRFIGTIDIISVSEYVGFVY